MEFVFEAKKRRCSYRSEIVRAPRLSLGGDERERILGIIRQAIETWPGKGGLQ